MKDEVQNVFLFDVDGTITPPRLPMTDEFAQFFKQWAIGKYFAMVSGSDIAKIEEQVPREILQMAQKIYACNGNDVYKYSFFGRENTFRHEFVPPLELIDYLRFELRWANCPFEKRPPHFELRHGLLNFSVIGRGASTEEREKYAEWDKVDGERARLVDGITQKFPQLEASAGGMISIDIVERGNSKAMVMLDLPPFENIYFFGDKLKEGNDKPLAVAIDYYCSAIEDSHFELFNVTGPDEVKQCLINLKN